MKIRYGFVSNSSSSSFIVFNDKSIIPQGIEYVKLNKKQKIKLIEECFINSIDDDIYLTEFISDSCDAWNKLYECEDEVIKNVKEYHSGGHGGPYDEERYDEIGENVWLYKGDSNENS
jgi:hypothetical protein